MEEKRYKSYIKKVCLFGAGVIFGCVISCYTGSGQDVLRICRYLIDHIVTLFQSVAFVLFLIVVWLRKKIVRVLDKLEENADDLLMAYMKRHVSEQSQYRQSSESPLNKEGKQI